MPNNFPSPLTILGIPTPRELFDEFISLKKRIDKFEKELANNKKQVERQNKQLEQVKTDLKKVKQQLKTPKKKKRQPSLPTYIKDNKLARKLREAEKKKHG